MFPYLFCFHIKFYEQNITVLNFLALQRSKWLVWHFCLHSEGAQCCHLQTFSFKGSPKVSIWRRPGKGTVNVTIILWVVISKCTLCVTLTNKCFLQQVLGEQYLKAALYPGGSSAALTHTAICCHPPLTKAAHINEINLRNSCEEKNPIYRHPGGYICNLEEIKPLNNVCQDDQWDQREAESPPLSWTVRWRAHVCDSLNYTSYWSEWLTSISNPTVLMVQTKNSTVCTNCH